MHAHYLRPESNKRQQIVGGTVSQSAAHTFQPRRQQDPVQFLAESGDHAAEDGGLLLDGLQSPSLDVHHLTDLQRIVSSSLLKLRNT